jgi:hypothetical protein
MFLHFSSNLQLLVRVNILNSGLAGGDAGKSAELNPRTNFLMHQRKSFGNLGRKLNKEKEVKVNRV